MLLSLHFLSLFMCKTMKSVNIQAKHLLSSIKWLLLIGVTFFLTTACARVTNPQGGPKDLDKPELVKSFPANQELNFKGQKIQLEFSELVQPNNLNKELLITPSVKNPYTVRTDKNIIELTFEEPLIENTTYFLNFREGIQDITEKNKAADLSIAFSTGPSLDSGAVAGNVFTLLTNQPEKNVDVLLYVADDTATIQKHRPYYVTKTREDGTFLFQNVKEDEYLIYALAEKNNNLIYDAEQERIAYLPSSIQISSDTALVQLRTQRIDTREPFIISQRPNLNLYAAEYNEGIAEVSLTEQTQPSNLLIPFNITENGKTLQIYPTTEFQEGQVIVQAQDSAGNAAIDTLEVSFTGKEVAPAIKGFALVGDKKEIRGKAVIEVQFEAPVKFLNNTPIALIEDTTTTVMLKHPEEISLKASGTRAEIIVNTKAQHFVDILPDSNAVVGLAGDKFSFKPIRLNINEEPDEGSISGTIATAHDNYWVELLNESYKIIRTAAPANNFNFANLNPGTYYIRVKIDQNNDGQWNEANPDLKTPVDPVYFYPTKIDVRADWEIGDNELQF